MGTACIWLGFKVYSLCIHETRNCCVSFLLSFVVNDLVYAVHFSNEISIFMWFLVPYPLPYWTLTSFQTKVAYFYICDIWWVDYSNGISPASCCEYLLWFTRKIWLIYGKYWVLLEEVMYLFLRSWGTGQETFVGGMWLLASHRHLTLTGKEFAGLSFHLLFLEIVAEDVLLFSFMTTHFLYLTL